MVNLVVTDTPFGEERQMHMGAQDGKGHWGIGLKENADVTLTTDYATAKDVFVSGNQQAGMQAFMAGKVKVQGDMTKLMMSQQGGGNAALSRSHPGHHRVARLLLTGFGAAACRQSDVYVPRKESGSSSEAGYGAGDEVVERAAVRVGVVEHPDRVDEIPVRVILARPERSRCIAVNRSATSYPRCARC